MKFLNKIKKIKIIKISNFLNLKNIRVKIIFIMNRQRYLKLYI